MNDPLFIEIDKFDQWAQSQYSIPQGDLGGEWECNYGHWVNVYAAFEKFLRVTDPSQWSDHEKERILYIIARDNETVHLVSILPELALIVLAKYAFKHGHRDDKWQLATQLHKLSDQQLAATHLEALVNDEDEYVSRRALMELGKVQSAKVEYYAELFWNRNKYGDMDEYQKIAVLCALKETNSKKLDKYIRLAKQDGRRYLVENAIKIESE